MNLKTYVELFSRMNTEKSVKRLLSASHTKSLLSLVERDSSGLVIESVAARLNVEHSVSQQKVVQTIQQLIMLDVFENEQGKLQFTSDYVEASSRGMLQSFLAERVVGNLISRIENAGLWAALIYLSKDDVFKLDSMTLPPSASGINSWIIEFGVAVRNTISDRYWYIVPQYNQLIKSEIEKLNNSILSKGLGVERFKERLENQRKNGDEAEKWVLNYERERLRNSLVKSQIRQVSITDVGAGYDIASFEDERSLRYDRFIEVKSFLGEKKFFWSSNEVEKAASLGAQYHLYLIDRGCFHEPSYKPTIVSAPSIELFKSFGSGWSVFDNGYMLKST